MNRRSRIYVAGHRGLVGSALVRALQAQGYTNMITRTHAELGLTEPHEVKKFFHSERPEYVFLAAGKVGGILANQRYPAEFLHTNLAIQNSVIHSAHLTGVKRLLFFGSNCTYPKECRQPMREEDLLSGPMEPTSESYAIAKIAGMRMCAAYNREYGTRFFSIIPPTVYGPHDNFSPDTSHVLSALIYKFHEAKAKSGTEVVLWGSGTPRREFMFVDDIASACLFLMRLDDAALLAAIRDSDFIINVGHGSDVSIRDLAQLIKGIVGYERDPQFDTSRPDGVPQKLLDSSRIRRLGWSPSVSLEEGVRRTYKWYCSADTRDTLRGEPQRTSGATRV